jgi:hypothetical protein
MMCFVGRLSLDDAIQNNSQSAFERRRKEESTVGILNGDLR